LTAASLRGLRDSLLRWYRAHRRDLPWRRTDDPYAIWVSEVMLQQTQVASVIPYYERFLERFPDVASLSRASEETVLGLWSGLGYYRRARSLLVGAREVVRRHAGRLPEDPRRLRELPGIGRYTAGAIASIAFQAPEPALDGNVRRVLARLFAVGDDGAERQLWRLAEELVQGPRPGELNQGLMELGALVCTPRDPACHRCPVRRRCRARQRGRQHEFPPVRERAAPSRVDVAVPWIMQAGKLLLERPATGNPLRGMWDLPAMELGDGADPPRRIACELSRRHDLEVLPGALVARSTHGIMNRRLRLQVFDCRLRRGRVSGRRDLRWLDPERLADTAVSGATLKVARALLPCDHSGGPAMPGSASCASGRIGPRKL
jgi:A/G-specific adenine glycosylase